MKNKSQLVKLVEKSPGSSSLELFKQDLGLLEGRNYLPVYLASKQDKNDAGFKQICSNYVVLVQKPDKS